MTKNIHDQRILILDFGSQYTQLVARRVREIGVYCELWSWDVEEADIREFNPDGIILSGGPESVTEENSPRAPQYVFDSGVPLLGVCYGMQTMAEQLGGKVAGSNEREFGYAQVKVSGECALFKDLEATQDVWMSHGDKVVEIPADFVKVGETDTCPYAAMANEEKKYYGVQFHPEVTHTKGGLQMLENFVLGVCGCERLWTSESIIEDAVARIKEQVGDDEVILGLSGGVDSSVVAMLVHRAIGDKLTCVFVDNGLLRLNEGQQVMDMFGDQFGLNIIKVDAEERFLKALEGKSDPEEKRKTIGHVFVDVFDEESKKLKNAKWLAQGTIYPDVIESAASKTGKAHVIKSHHNVGGLPEKMDLKLVEPLRELFKDEVRALGRELGLPDSFVGRHPFPGPGLAIRCPGGVNKEKADILRKADAIYLDEIRKCGQYDKIWQAFAVLLPVQTVGVMGDGRTYESVCALRAVTSVDGMTADFYHYDMEFLGRTATRIINEVKGINRVVYDVTSKPPGTIEWE